MQWLSEFALIQDRSEIITGRGADFVNTRRRLPTFGESWNGANPGG